METSTNSIKSIFSAYECDVRIQFEEIKLQEAPVLSPNRYKHEIKFNVNI